MNHSLTIEKSIDTNEVLVIRVGGRLDSRGAIVLREYCTPHLGTKRCLVLSLRDATFLSSGGVGALLALTEAAKETGGTLHIAEVGGAVLSTLALLHLDEYLSLHETEQQAILTGR